MTTTIDTTATFEVGNTYSATSPCDSDCVWTFEVTKRTAKFITLQDVRSAETMRVGVRVHSDAEWASPFGSFSMAPVICADRVAA